MYAVRGVMKGTLMSIYQRIHTPDLWPAIAEGRMLVSVSCTSADP